MDTAKSKKIGWGRHQIHTEIAIDAAPDLVWSVLSDTASYKDWAMFMVGIDGPIVDGGEIGVAFQLDPAKDKVTSINHTISVVDGAHFLWAEKGPMGISDNHHFRVEPGENGTTRFIQTDEIQGGMTWLLGGYLSKMYVNGYQSFNRSLKAESERRAQSLGT